MTLPPDKPDAPAGSAPDAASPEAPAPEARARTERAQRLAAALRDNLRRRKAARPIPDNRRN